MVTTKEVQHAKTTLKFFIQNESWFRGIGIGDIDGQLGLRVYVSEITPAVLESVPDAYLGVPVVRIIMKDIKAQDQN